MDRTSSFSVPPSRADSFAFLQSTSSQSNLFGATGGGGDGAAAAASASAAQQRRSPSSTQLYRRPVKKPPRNKTTLPSVPPALRSRNVLIDRYSGIEQDSRAAEVHYQKSVTNTIPHTPTTVERERAARERLPDPHPGKRINQQPPHEVSVGGVGRDLTLLSMVQQLDLNVCGVDLCAMDMHAARHQHVTDIVDHSRSELHWRRNPFTEEQQRLRQSHNAKHQQQQQQQQQRRNTVSGDIPFVSTATETGVAAAAAEQRKSATTTTTGSPLRTMREETQAVQACRSVVAMTDVAKARRAGALESRLRHKFRLLMEEERRQAHAERVRAGLANRDDDVVLSAADDPDAHRRPIIVNREATWLRLMYLGVFCSELKGQVEEVKATKLLRRVFSREMYRYLRRKRRTHDRAVFERTMLASEFKDAAVNMFAAAGGATCTIQPPQSLLLRAFPVLKLDAHGYTPPSVMLAGALASKRGAPLAKAVAITDDSIHGMARIRISDEHLQLLGSVFRPRVFKKGEPLSWSAPPLSSQQQQQQQSYAAYYPPPRSGGANDTDWWSESDAQIYILQSGMVRLVYRQARRPGGASMMAAAAAAAASGGGGGGGDDHGGSVAGGGAASSSASQAAIPGVGELRRSQISGAETLTPGRILGLELLVPEQAKRYVALAATDVAAWTAPVRDVMAILEQINPWGDPDRKTDATAALMASSTAGAGGGADAGAERKGKAAPPPQPVLTTPEQILAHKLERESVILVGKLMHRMVLLRKQEIFLAQTPPTPSFLRTAAPLLLTWSDGGLTELCRALDAVFVEKGQCVPLRRDRPNRGYTWYYLGGSSAVNADAVIPPSTAPPSHCDWVYFVVHGSVSIMGRRVFESRRGGGGGGNNADSSPSSPSSPITTTSTRGGISQKLVQLDVMKPGQSFGVASCLLGTLLDTAMLSAIATALSANGTPTSALSKGRASGQQAAAAAALAAAGAGGDGSNEALIANAGGMVLSTGLNSNIKETAIKDKDFVGVELHATQDAVLWRLDKNILMHVLAHEHVGTLLSPFSLYQQLGKLPGQ